MNVKVHNKHGEVICEVIVKREIGNSHDFEKWLWDTAEHIADEIKKRSEAFGALFAKQIGQQIDKRENPGWWDKLKRRIGGTPDYFVDIPTKMFEDYRCPTCDCDTIQPMSRVGPLWVVGYSPQYELGGYSCQNPYCPMHDVVVLKILVDKIDEKPQR
jgi:hypothetical protein